MNALQVIQFLGIAKRQCHPACTRAAGTAYAVYISFRYFRQLVVDHMRQLVYINTARRDVRCHKNTDVARIECTHRKLSCTLAFVAMYSRSANA